ncbi:MAG: hypothetical protein QXQ31_05735 [Zestosphaera sp.]
MDKAELVKKLLLEEFKRQGLQPPRWLDDMVQAILRRAESGERIDKLVKEAVDAYIDTKDIVETWMAEVG